MKARWLLEAAGAAILLLLPYFYPLVFPSGLLLYHHPLPITNIVRGLLLDLLGVILLGYALIVLLARLSPVLRRIAGSCLAALVLWRFAGVSLMLLGLWGSGSGSEGAAVNSSFVETIFRLWNLSAHAIAVGLVLFFGVLAWRKPTSARRIVYAIRLGLSGFAFSAVWLVPRLCFFAFAAHAPTPVAAAASADLLKRPDQRVVWILFDELSYDLVFDHKPAGIAVPNFEKLRAASISYGNLEPVGHYTDRVIPSLLSGQTIGQIRSDHDGTLFYKDAHERWVAYDPKMTLFGLAQTNGWNPGVAGWYNPYCRTFATILASCFWQPTVESNLLLETYGASQDKSPLANAIVLPCTFLEKLSRHTKAAGPKGREGHIREYQSIMAHASALINDESVRFVFLHLPVPHPLGIYDRKTHELRDGGDYLDNLELADKALGMLMQEIDDTASASQTTVVVSSDHSWRPFWRSTPDWTKEEERISQGGFDERPVFLIHFPGESNGRQVLAPLPELTEHDILAAMLRHEMKGPDDLGALLSESRQPGVSSSPEQRSLQ